MENHSSYFSIKYFNDSHEVRDFGRIIINIQHSKRIEKAVFSSENHDLIINQGSFLPDYGNPNVKTLRN